MCPTCRARYDVTGRRAGARGRCRCGTSIVVPSPSTSAAVLKCPSCGANCEPDRTSCSYCRAVLATVACPSCFGHAFVGSEFCVHCGAALLKPAQDMPEQFLARNCPRCEGKMELVPRLVAQTTLDECTQCGGVWLESDIFQSLLKDRDEQAQVEMMADGYLQINALTANAPPARQYIPCPDCHQLMNQKNFGICSGVIIDICKHHGVWFDRGELSRILKFVMNGGMEKARQREVEKTRRELQHKKDQLISMQSTSLDTSSDIVQWRTMLRMLASFFFSGF